jgi:hypothetical protein
VPKPATKSCAFKDVYWPRASIRNAKPPSGLNPAAVFVLGLGSGHHVAELEKATQAKIIVLETNEDILSAAAEIHSFSERVCLAHLPNARTLRKIDAVKSAVAKSFIVLAHAPSLAVDAAVYKECRAQLLGRDWGSLNWQWKLRNAPEFDRNPRIDAKGEPLSLHDLEQTELVSNSEERERLLFKALRELVK